MEPDDLSAISVERASIDVSELDGQTVSGTIMVSIEAEGWMREVRFHLDGVLELTLVHPPFEFEIDTTELADAEHTLGYEAVMANGRVRDSETVTFFVHNAQGPVVTVVAGEGGAIVAAPEGPYRVGDVVGFVAVPDDGYAQLAWGDACGEVAAREECTLELVADVRVSVTFELMPWVEPDPHRTEYGQRALELGAIMIHAATRQGETWLDDSGNGLHGTVINDPEWHETGGPGAGLPGYFAFDAGLEQYVDVGHDPLIAFTGPHTLVWWERNGTGAREQYAYRLGKGDRGFFVRRHGDDGLRYFIRDADQEAIASSSDFLDATEWTMLVARFDGDEATVWAVGDDAARRVAHHATSGLIPESAEDHFAYAAQDDRRFGGEWRRWWSGELAGGLAFDYALSSTEMVGLAAAALGETSPPAPPPEPDPVAPVEPYPDPQTMVGIVGEDWYINGVVVNPGSRAEGLLMNSRMVQATFEDENPTTVHEWAYPNGDPYDPQRQTDEFVAMVPSYADLGLNAVTVSLQGGRPRYGDPYGRSQPWINTAFNDDGTLRPGYMERMAQVIEALDQHGMVAILSYFYFGQDDQFPNEFAIFTGIEHATQWVLDKGYTNVIIELANEVGHWQWSHDIFSDPNRAHELVSAARNVAPDLLYGCSLGGGHIPPDSLIAAADFHLPHGNSQTASRVAEMVDDIRSSPAYGGEPIVFNEDSTNLDNMYAAVGAGAGWGYYDQGVNDYHTGFQSPPTNWAINTPEKQAFFEAVEALTTEVVNPEPAAYVDTAKDLGAVLVLNRERSGGRWLDESGNDLHGSEHNSPTWYPSGGPTTSIPGFYRFASASEQHIDVGDDPLFRFTNAMTIVWWERHGDQSGDAAHAVRIGKGDVAYQIRRNSYSTDTVRFTVRNDRTINEGSITASEAASDAWQMFMARYDGSQVTLHRIVDGTAMQIASTSYSGGIEANTDRFAIAAQHDGVGWRRWWSGDMAGLLAFPAALSAAQFEQLHAAAQQESGTSSPTNPVGDELAAQTGVVHLPFLAWRIEASDYGSINPYDVEAEATFTARDGGHTYRVPLFYAGDGTFEFRFTGPRTGSFDIITSSPHSASLDGLTGTATITSNPDPYAKGFMTTVANADGTGSFAYLQSDDGTPRRMLYNPQVRAATATDPVGFSHLWVGLGGLTTAERGARIEANLDHMEAHGFHAIEFNVAHNFVEWGLTNRQTSTNTEPDPYTFTVIEDLLERALARGRFMHIWAWSDEEAGGSSADLPGGINGFVDERVQRMIVGRLGAYPNWAMSYGYDLEEYVRPEELRAWHANMRALGSLPRLYMAREADDRAPAIVLDLGMDKLDVFSWDGRPQSDWYADALAQFGRSPAGMALIYERRFWSDRDDVWYEDVARRAAWQFSMANGASAIFGQGRAGTSATPEYEHPEIWKTLHDFWEHRFRFPLVVDSVPADGMVLSDAERSVVYKEEANSVTVDVKREGSQVVAVSTTSAYAQYDLGRVDAGERLITLPSTGNWVVAVGDFGDTGELIDRPGEVSEPGDD